MTRLPAYALALTLALAALPGAAQDTAKTDSAASADVSMGVPDGMPTKDTAQVGQLYLAQKFDAWELRCIKKEDGKDPCQLYQLLHGADGGAVAEASFFNLPAGAQAAAGATIIAPLETLLTANLKLAIDGAQAKLYPYSFCNTNGCVAKVGFTADELKAMESGSKAVMTIVPAAAPDKTVTVEVSLKGFTEGFKALPAK